MIAFRVEHDYIRLVFQGQSSRLFHLAGFHWHGTLAVQKGAEDFARFGTFVDNQHTGGGSWQGIGPQSLAEGRNASRAAGPGGFQEGRGD